MFMEVAYFGLDQQRVKVPNHFAISRKQEDHYYGQGCAARNVNVII